jgi:hypothetical protein
MRTFFCIAMASLVMREPPAVAAVAPADIMLCLCTAGNPSTSQLLIERGSDAVKRSVL